MKRNNDVKPIRFAILPSEFVRINLIGLLLLFSFQSEGQQIIWEKYWPNVKGQFNAVVQGDSGYFFGVGLLKVIRNFEQPPQSRDTLEGIILVKLTQEGDTVWFKKIFPNTGAPPDIAVFLVANELDGTVSVIFRNGIPPGKGLKIFTASQVNGGAFLSAEIPEFPNYPQQVSNDISGSIYIVGEQRKLFAPNEYEMFCIKINQMGQVVFQNGYSPNNHPTSAAQYIEPMPGGKMRMSGNKGKTIVAYELNADGSVADYKEYMDNPYNFVQQDGAYVQQSDSGHFLVSVNRFSGTSVPNLKSAVRKVNAQGDMIWNGIRPYGITQPIPLLDGGYIITAGNVTDYFVQRFKNDSTLEWQENFMPDPNSIKGFNGMLFNNNEGLCFGQISRFASNPGWFPYLAKIANVGYPVDPTNPIPPVLGSKETRRKSVVSYAVPNPTTGIFHLLGMGSGQFRMVDANGRTVLEAEHKGGDAIDISNLPCGVYTYTLVTPQSRTEGRVVRE